MGRMADGVYGHQPFWLFIQENNVSSEIVLGSMGDCQFT